MANQNDLFSLLGGVGGTALGGPVGGALGGGLGSVLGGLFSDAPDYTSIYGSLNVPDAQTLINAGKLGPTAYDQVKEDPATRAAQMQALAYLQNVGTQNGMDLQSQVAQREAMNAANQNDAANRAAVLNNMAMRGMRGGGAELAAQLSGAQSSAQANAMAGQRAAADARTRALQSMMGAGQLGGQVRGQDWSNATDRAAARDRIAQFNAQNARSAYEDAFRMGLAKAQGMSGAAQAQYGRDVNMGGAAGTLAGGAAGYGLDALMKRRSQPISWSQYDPKYQGFKLED